MLYFCRIIWSTFAPPVSEYTLYKKIYTVPAIDREGRKGIILYGVPEFLSSRLGEGGGGPNSDDWTETLQLYMVESLYGQGKDCGCVS